MKIQVQKKALECLVKEAVKFSNNKTKANYLKTLWFKVAEKAQIQITDASIEYQASLPAEIFEPGIIGINAKNFQKLLKSLSNDTLILSGQNNKLTIKQGKRHFEIEGMDESWFIEFDSLPVDFIEMSDLKKTFDKIEPFALKDSDFNVTNLVNIESLEDSLRIMATDNSRFSMLELPHPGFFPAKMQLQGTDVAKLKKWLNNKPTGIGFKDEKIYFYQQDEVVSLPYKTENWAEYSAFFDKFNNDVTTMVVERKALLSSLEILYNFCTQEAKSISLTLNRSQVKISHEENASEILEADCRGDIKKRVFPCLQLLEIIKQLSGEFITLEFTENFGPCRIKENNHTLLIMPVLIYEDEENEV